MASDVDAEHDSAAARGADSSADVDSDTDPSADADSDVKDETDVAVDTDATGVEEPAGRPCPLCGASMYHRHCKYVCPDHGVVYDCADTFY